MRIIPADAGSTTVDPHLIDAPRIIPADAGSTPRLTLRPPAVPDHPRGCGEHLVAAWRDGGHEGSSPRMRGAHSLAECGQPADWIIPADAGSTRIQFGRVVVWEDHPRGCGEHYSMG